MAIDWNKVIEQSLEQAPAILGGAALIIAALRRKLNRLEANQKRIEEKADGNHARALEAIKQAGKYEGKEEAKNDARFDQEQIMKAFEQALTAAAQRRGKRKTDPP